MLGTIVFCNFNNYYNREFKKFETLAEYSDYFVGQLPNVNFNPNDGVNTKVDQLIENPAADYLLYTENDVIISRWYILESQRKSSGLWELSIRRDVIADNWEKIINSPAYIEKAIVSQDNPLILNKENFSCNQIKIAESYIYDETDSAWIIGFLDRKTESTTINGTATVIPDYTAETLQKWQYYNLLNKEWYINEGTKYTIDFKIRYDGSPLPDTGARVVIDSNGANLVGIDVSQVKGSLSVPNYQATNFASKFKDAYATLQTYKNLYISDLNQYSDSSYNKCIEIIPKILKAGVTYYQFGSTVTASKDKTYAVTEDKIEGYILSYLQGIATSVQGVTGSLYAEIVNRVKYVVLKEKENQFQNWTTTIPAETDRYHLKDAPYDMFIMPYGDKIIQVAGNECTITKDIAMNYAQGMAQALGTKLLDIQIQPYCPATGIIASTGTINYNTNDTKRYGLIKNGDTVVGAYLWCTASSGQKVLTGYRYEIDDLKMFNNCYKYRLSAGNHAAGFDFNVAQNGGKIDGWTLVYSYLPVSSYVRLAPMFTGLYGSEFNDGRGMTQQGDYSITYINDTWVTYQNNQKNYLNSFQRTMENLDVQRGAQRLEQLIGSTVGAAGAGVQAGSVFGAGVGIGAGALSAVGGLADLGISEKLYRENKQYQKDQFNYTLDNVKATPNTLGKVVAYSNDNKIIPVLEIYKATDTEIEAFYNMIKYQGMTVGVIDLPSKYLYNSYRDDKGFIKARPIQLKDLSDDYHMATAISDELSLGIYTK